jgi:hypothetical protein
MEEYEDDSPTYLPIGDQIGLFLKNIGTFLVSLVAAPIMLVLMVASFVIPVLLLIAVVKWAWRVVFP